MRRARRWGGMESEGGNEKRLLVTRRAEGRRSKEMESGRKREGSNKKKSALCVFGQAYH